MDDEAPADTEEQTDPDAASEDATTEDATTEDDGIEGEDVDVDVPTVLGEGVGDDFRPWAAGYNPDDPVDRAVMATRGAVFPHHGLDPQLR